MNVQFRDVLVLSVLAMLFVASMLDKIPFSTFIAFASSVMSFYFGMALGAVMAVRKFVSATMFDDWYSIAHFALGAVSHALLMRCPAVPVALTVLYVVYQLADYGIGSDTLAEMIGDLSEYAFGALAGAYISLLAFG